MKTKLHIWAMLPLLTVLSCTVETWEDDSIMDPTALGNVNFKAYLDDSAASTRTSLGEKDDNGFYPVYWSENDKIKIMTPDCAPGEGREFTLTEGAGTAQGVFNGSLNQPGEENVYLAVFPYSTKVSFVDEGRAHLSLTLPQEQRYVENTFDINANPAFAVTTNDELHFKNACGLLKLDITGDVKVKRIKLHAIDTSEPLWGTYEIRIYDYPDAFFAGRDYPSVAFEVFFGLMNAAEAREPALDPYSLYLNCDEPVQLTDTPTTFYFVVPAGALSPGFQLELYDENGRVVGYRKTLEANAAERSKLREMPVIDFRMSDLETGANPEAINLSANGTANSYIVHPQADLYPDGRLYTFYALRKGNGEYPIVGGKSVRVEFRTFNLTYSSHPGNVNHYPVPDDAVIKDVTFDETTGFISFRNSISNIPVYCYDDEGRLLVDENNNPITEDIPVAEGNATITLLDENHRPLWSWHIWVTDYDPETTNETYYNGTGAIMMTRNLGALSDNGTRSYGLFYQWGRKDPFITETEYVSFPEQVFDYGNPEVSGSDALEYAIQHPTTIVSTGYEWWIEPTVSPWERNKTLNDPCPPGWRVPDPETFFFSDLFNQYTGLFNEVNETGWSGRMIGKSGHQYYFPSRPGAGNSNGAYWSCYVPNILGSISMMEGSMYHFSPTSVPNMVRCQREDTGIPDSFTDLSANGTANCYVINKPGRYKFRADVKGNSDESVGGVAKAVISWQSTPTYTEEPWSSWSNPFPYRKSLISEQYGAGVYYKDGYVYLVTNYQWIQGSTIVSVLDDVGRVLWSWHLWLTDYNPYSTDGYIVIPSGSGSVGGSDRQMMKYNLGAVMDVIGQDSAGLRGMMYQWGRKDPFIGAFNSTGSLPGVGGEYLSYVSDASIGNVNYVTQNPTVIIKGNGSNVTDWHYAHDNSLWGEEKTKYDPCPPGYKVPSKGSGYLTVEPSSYGFRYGGDFVPAGGYRYYASGDLEEVGYVASYWSSTPAEGDATSAYSFYWNGGDLFDVSTHTSYKAQCNHVRCVRE
jgi:hypothetical protein